MRAPWRGILASLLVAIASCSLRDVSDLTRDTHAAPEADAGCTLGRYACAVLDERPLLYLRFAEANASDGVIDASGRSSVRSAYPLGTTVQVPGALGVEQPNAAAHLPASGGGIRMPAGLDFTDRAPFTVEVWIKPEAPNPAVIDSLSIVLDHETWSTDRAGWVLVYHPGSTSISFELWTGGEGFFAALSADGAVPLAVWHHIVFAFDGSLATLWVDGQSSIATVAPRSLPIVPEGWRIGDQNCDGCGSNAYQGGIDELAIYDRALDDAVVKRHLAVAREAR